MPHALSADHGHCGNSPTDALARHRKLVTKPIHAYVLLLVGVVSISFGAILTRYAQQEAPSLTVAAYRMIFASVLVLVPTWVRQRSAWKSLSARDFLLAVISGFFLAVHFATWIYSLELTTVAISVVLVNTVPIWVGVLTVLTTKERASMTQVLSIAIAVLGAILIGCGIADADGGQSSVLGAVFALAGAIALAAYLLIGRGLQRRISLGVYVTACYGTAACFLLFAAVLTRQQILNFSWATWSYLLGLAILCQVVGHSANNWALRFFSASMVSVALLGEPILSTLYASLLFQESLTLLQAIGGTMILIGIYLTILTEHAPTSPAETSPTTK